MMKLKSMLNTVAFISQLKAQQIINNPDSNTKKYLAELSTTGKNFTSHFYPEYATIYSLPEKKFISKIDSARNIFINVLNKYKTRLNKNYINDQSIEIRYYFDKLLIEYPLNHDIYTGKTSSVQSLIPKRLNSNLPDFNKPGLLLNADFTNYVRAFFAFKTHEELKKPAYQNHDNQHLLAVWNIIPQYISEAQCRDFWMFDFLYNHIDNNGIKNIHNIYYNFKTSCRDTAYQNKIGFLYSQDSVGRQGHLVKTYKTVDSLSLDIHVFLPDSLMNAKRRPVMVCYHGGSWSEGKPDWFFNSCEDYAKKGWIACAVEYRTSGKNGTLPFAAVMDARSVIRWLRQNAYEFNIDTNRIVATGNSAGGHLALATALADNWNEKTDDMKFSSVPNLLIIISGVYDLTDTKTSWIRKDLKNKDLVKEISPNNLVKMGMPPTLIIHGTNDGNVPYASAKKFSEEMTKAGNNFDFKSLDGAEHFIWYHPGYAPQVSKLRSDFLHKSGY